MSETGLPSAAAPEAPMFRAVLRPYRSLSGPAFLILMGLFGFVSFATGIVFLMMGAWPVLGFCGLDVALVWLAFHLNYRAALRYETVEIFERELVVTHVAPSGEEAWRYAFNPYWARVSLATLGNGRTDLRLSSHGRSLSLGRFLTDDERRRFADALGLALARARGTKG